MGANLDYPEDAIVQYDKIFGKTLDSQIDYESPIVSIEYFVVNLPHTLSEEPRNITKILSESSKPEFFENEIIQTIINFKWN